MKKATVFGTTLLGMLLGAQLAGAATETEWEIPFPSPVLTNVAVGGSGIFYVDTDGTVGTAYVGSLQTGPNPAQAKFKEIATPFFTSTGDDLRVRPSDGGLFMTDDATRSLALINLDTDKLTIWTMPPAADGGPKSIAFDGSGRVLFLSSASSVDAVVGRFDPASGLVETWTIPETIDLPGSDFAWRIVLAADGSVFFNVNGFSHVPAGGVLARLDLGTGVFTSWQTALQPVFGIAADGSGSVYFQELGSSVTLVARLVPATNTLTEWTLPDGVEMGNNLIFDSGRLVFGNDIPAAIATLDPAQPGTDSTLSPVVNDPVAPISVVVTPTVTTPPLRFGRAKGTATPSVPTSDGPFVLFPTSSPNDGPGWVAGNGTGTIYFTGGFPNPALGRLTP